jgi:hypothetical protein
VSSPLLLGEPPLVAAGAWIWFGESLNAVEIAGSAVVVGSLWGVVRSPELEHAEADAPDPPHPSRPNLRDVGAQCAPNSRKFGYSGTPGRSPCSADRGRDSRVNAGPVTDAPSVCDLSPDGGDGLSAAARLRQLRPE